MPNRSVKTQTQNHNGSDFFKIKAKKSLIASSHFMISFAYLPPLCSPVSPFWTPWNSQMLEPVVSFEITLKSPFSLCPCSSLFLLLPLFILQIQLMAHLLRNRMVKFQRIVQISVFTLIIPLIYPLYHLSHKLSSIFSINLNY